MPATDNYPTVSIGDAVLDSALQGGLPCNRTVLLTGTPGTGKSTLAMQFLQAGLTNRERWLDISTEQTSDELYTGFAPFEFDLNHENLTVTTMHAKPGTMIESDEEELTHQALEGGEAIPGEAYGIPFTSKRILDHLEQYAPCDRVVLDSASGLKMMNDDETVYRRAILDLIRLFTDEFDATSIVTAEYTGAPQPTEGSKVSAQRTRSNSTSTALFVSGGNSSGGLPSLPRHHEDAWSEPRYPPL